MDETREWESGAYRDTNSEKLDYEAFYSPLVVREFARYMHKHRKQANGKLRAGDNWQGLFGSPGEHRKVCMSSLWRHFEDLWLLHRGYRVEGVTVKEVLCAILFNVQAYLFSILIEEEKEVSHSSDLPLGNLFDCKLIEKGHGNRIFVLNDALGEVRVYSSPIAHSVPGYLCDCSACGAWSTRRLVYMYKGTKITTNRCDKHETMPIQRED